MISGRGDHITHTTLWPRIHQSENGNPHKLQILELEITLRCPLRCVHCSVNGGESKTDIPFDKFCQIVDDCQKLEVEALDIIGGEPLAYPQIYQALEYAMERIPKVYLNTSGYFINDRIIAKLRDVGLKYIFISLDGATPESHERIRGPGTFRRTCDAIKRLSDAGFNVTVSFVVNSENHQEIPKLMEICERYGATRLFLLSLIPTGRGKNIGHLTPDDVVLKKVLEMTLHTGEQKHKVEISLDCSIRTDFGSFPEHVKICPAGTTFCTIKANGDVTPCGFLYPKLIAGNIFKDRFYDIWLDDNRFHQMRNAIDGCESCTIYRKCRGGCQALKAGKACDEKPENRVSFFKQVGII